MVNQGLRKRLAHGALAFRLRSASKGNRVGPQVQKGAIAVSA